MATTANIFTWLQNFTNGVWGNTFNNPNPGKWNNCLNPAPGMECGWDIGMPWGTPVGSPVNGTIVAIDSSNASNSIGYVVQIRQKGTFPVGWYSGQDTIWHFQHLMAPPTGLQVGQTITAGQVIGYSGGCPSGGYGSANQSCTSTDKYSTGPHIEVREAYVPTGAGAGSPSVWGYPWINPQSDLSYYAKVIGKWSPRTSTTASPSNIPGNPNAGLPNPCGDILAAAYATAAQDSNPVTSALTKSNANMQYALCQLQASIVGWGEHIAIFVLAIVLIIVGFFLLAGRQAGAIAQKVGLAA